LARGGVATGRALFFFRGTENKGAHAIRNKLGSRQKFAHDVLKRRADKGSVQGLNAPSDRWDVGNSLKKLIREKATWRRVRRGLSKALRGGRAILSFQRFKHV